MPQSTDITDQRPGAMEAGDDANMFDLAPVSLWLEDYSPLKQLFEAWRREGVTDLRDFLRQDPARVKACSDRLHVIKVNRKTLALYGATDLDDLVNNLGRVFRDDMLDTHVDELVALWNGQTSFSSLTVNYTLSGQRLDIQLSGSFLPGHEESWTRILIAVEDVSERESARRQLAASENYARELFEQSPVSLWVEDFSSVKRLLDDARARGIVDFRVFTDVHEDFVEHCMAEIHVLDVNRHTLKLFAAPDKPTLFRRLSEVFRGEMHQQFREQLIDLWNGKLFQQREVINYTLDGRELYLHLQFSVLHGYEDDWSLVQVALTDITARKKAEAYLEFLGRHDVLTKLYNRSFFNDEIDRLERRSTCPVTIIVADLNGLKSANDELGHAAGDDLLRRIGEVLQKAVEKPYSATRTGGDEFAILMPNADEKDGAAMIGSIQQLIELNNQFNSDNGLSLAVGMATSRPGERLEAVVQRADRLMYENKAAFYDGGSTRPDAELR